MPFVPSLKCRSLENYTSNCEGGSGKACQPTNTEVGLFIVCCTKGKVIQLQAWIGSEDSRILRLLDFLDSQNKKVAIVNPTHRLPLLSLRYTWYSLTSEPESNAVRQEGLNKWKFIMTPPRIEPVTFRLLARLRHRAGSRFLPNVCANVSNYTVSRIARQIIK